ncbi:hypothetical protein KSS87_007725 [Heliosperma pusillum]|nr:hypothetical protein KSS87_007725 [Heliosperma pusillum]
MLRIGKKVIVEEERRKGFSYSYPYSYWCRSLSRIAAAAAAAAADCTSNSSSIGGGGFGIAFDIDGVLLRGNTPIGGSPRALAKLYHPQGEPAAVLSHYGFKHVISIDDYALCFDHIDPLAPHKKWIVDRNSQQGITFPSPQLRNYVSSHRVQAVFIVSDSVDWSRDIQVLCDILTTGGLPGGEPGTQPHLYFAHDDLKYQGAFPTQRFGMGAFRISLQSVYNSIHPHPLQYSALGKPNPLAFKNAEMALRELCTHEFSDQRLSGYNPFKTLYMIGDNPSVDIKGAHKAGHPWFSILTKTGVFRGERQDHEFQADMVVDTVEEAVEFILDKEKVN